ncbi:hypothetical protein KUTeg_018513 [Tegillarca granosa]|uniref:Protein misato n=1 Tax=Tegillarca granosa TaxID=220873 RepID=A0ABQ9EN08_TEGGR|nr:hypothetical protein KUTeg_018513 [Tegillarca granosa]
MEKQRSLFSTSEKKMDTKEIVTLQIGHYSNFVGAHWWNIQESTFVYDPKKVHDKEVNHDILFREGQNLRGDVTYTPRLVAFDLKGSLNTLKIDGKLYEYNQQEDINWTGDVTLHQTSTTPKNVYLKDLEKEEEAYLKGNGNSSSIEDVEIKDSKDITDDISAGTSNQVFGKKFYELDEAVSVWSDYLRVHLHPKSTYIIEDFTHKNELSPFDIYGCGHSLMSNYDRNAEIEDRLHYFIEECDHLQGFHILIDTNDGFGGLGSDIVQYLQDEYSTKGLFTFGLTPSTLPDNTASLRANRILNSVITYSRCIHNSSLFSPLSLADSLWKTVGPSVQLPYLNYKSISYHSSAILAASLDNLTLPYRNLHQPIHIRDVTDNMQILGRKVVSLSTSLPFPLVEKSNLVDSIYSLEGKLPWYSVTPHVKNESDPFLQSSVIRGIPADRVKRPHEERQLYSSCQSLSDVLQIYLQDKYPSTNHSCCVLRDPCNVLTPFPHIFRQNINKYGQISTTNRHMYEGKKNSNITRFPL